MSMRKRMSPAAARRRPAALFLLVDVLAAALLVFGNYFFLYIALGTESDTVCQDHTMKCPKEILPFFHQTMGHQIIIGTDKNIHFFVTVSIINIRDPPYIVYLVDLIQFLRQCCAKLLC